MKSDKDLFQHRQSTKPDQEQYIQERRKEDRRKMPSEGFAYMPIVGWICRREQVRRKADRLDGVSGC